MSNWKLLVPADVAGGLINAVTNPSLETDPVGWTDIGIPVSSGRSTTAAAFGVFSYGMIPPVIGSNGAYYDVTVSAATDYYAIIHYLLQPGHTATYQVKRNDTNAVIATATVPASFTGVFDFTKPFTRYSLPFTTPAGVTSIRIEFTNIFPPDPTEILLDGLCVTTADITYIDGDQPGCEWLGVAHASRSTFGASSRANGIEKDFTDDYNFHISEVIDIKAQPLITLDGYATQDGARTNSIKDTAFTFSLVGVLKSASGECDVHTERSALISALSHDSYPQDENGWQKVPIVYTGADIEKICYADFDGGLSGNWQAALPGRENLALRFTVPDARWYARSNSAAVLDLNDNATFRYIAGRIKDRGQWYNLNQTAGGGAVQVIKRSPTNGLYYIGFDGTDWNGDVNQDYITAYDEYTDTFNQVGPASSFNGSVRAIDFDAAGNIYIGGSFTDGAGDKDHIVKFDGTNYTALGSPTAGTAAINYITAVRVDLDGNVWVGGSFTNFAGVVDADYIAYWDGTSWNAADKGLNSDVYDIDFDSDGNIWAGGSFTQDGNANIIRHIAIWNGAYWAEVGGGLNTTVYDITIDKQRTIVYAGGIFTQNGAGTVTGINRIAQWNGTIWERLGDGIQDGAVLDSRLGDDGMLWVCGSFTIAGDLERTTAYIARWNGSTWLYTDIALTGMATAYSIELGKSDAIVKRNYTVMVGLDTTAAAQYYNGTVNAVNIGNKRSYPKITIERTDTSTTVCDVRSVRNETTGDAINMDYRLLAGEILTIDTTPNNMSVNSNFRGRVTNAIKPGSDLSAFSIYPGTNQITAFCYVAGAGVTLSGSVTFTPTYKSFD